jgi:hypothetical protein
MAPLARPIPHDVAHLYPGGSWHGSPKCSLRRETVAAGYSSTISATAAAPPRSARIAARAGGLSHSGPHHLVPHRSRHPARCFYDEESISCPNEGWPELCPVSFSIPGGFLVVMPRARRLHASEWKEFDYRAFVTRGDPYWADNFDAHAGTWTQRDPGQPLHALTLGNAEPSAGLIPAEYKPDSFGLLNGRVVAVDYG